MARVRPVIEEFAASMFDGFARRDQRVKGELYLRGLMLDGKRKSMQPMAARLGVDHQQLQQFVTTSTWDHVEVRRRLTGWAAGFVDPDALVIDDTGFPKDGKDSPGVARMYCGALGKTGNCQIDVSVHAVTGEWGLSKRPVVADAGYGDAAEFRLGLTERGLTYVLAVTRLVIATGDPQPGNHNDCTVYRESGIKDQLEGRPVMTDGGYQGNPEVIMPYRKPADGSDLPEWKEELNAIHRKVRARVEHALARMKCWKILRDYRRAASTLSDTVSGIAHLHNIALTH
jgi:hypothetical protein